MRISVVFVLGLIIIGDARGDVSAPAATLSSDDAIIVTARNANRCQPGRYFTPKQADVARVTALIRAALEQYAKQEGYPGEQAKAVLERLPRYRRFYTGVVRPERRTISVQGFCPELVLWTHCAPEVADGGPCVWWLTFDLRTGAFVGFGTNGEG